MTSGLVGCSCLMLHQKRGSISCGLCACKVTQCPRCLHQSLGESDEQSISWFGRAHECLNPMRNTITLSIILRNGCTTSCYACSLRLPFNISGLFGNMLGCPSGSQVAMCFLAGRSHGARQTRAAVILAGILVIPNRNTRFSAPFQQLEQSKTSKCSVMALFNMSMMVNSVKNP